MQHDPVLALERLRVTGAALVRVGRLDDVIDVRARPVGRVTTRHERAGAVGVGRRLRGGVRVLVVAERVGHAHLGAVDRAVLGVGHLDLERDALAELGEPAVDRRLEGHRRPGIAGDHG
jgi:hypothetical protein